MWSLSTYCPRYREGHQCIGTLTLLAVSLPLKLPSGVYQWLHSSAISTLLWKTAFCSVPLIRCAKQNTKQLPTGRSDHRPLWTSVPCWVKDSGGTWANISLCVFADCVWHSLFWKHWPDHSQQAWNLKKYQLVSTKFLGVTRTGSDCVRSIAEYRYLQS